MSHLDDETWCFDLSPTAELVIPAPSRDLAEQQAEWWLHKKGAMLTVEEIREALRPERVKEGA